tara:strand:- start:173 stop:319 length:147 start_codon:yes stop_codon:yes gene_type:complete
VVLSYSSAEISHIRKEEQIIVGRADEEGRSSLKEVRVRDLQEQVPSEE